MSNAPDQASATSASPAYFPPSHADEWQTLKPEALGWEARRIADLLSYVEEKNSTGFVILSGGRILVEQYWLGAGTHSGRDVASVQKSVTSLLFGIAQESGLLRLDDSVSMRLGAGWSNAPEPVESQITLRHLLTMTSGLDAALASEAEPGTVWFYNTPAYHLLKAAIAAASAGSFGDFSAERLFAAIGLRDSSWQDRPNMSGPQGARARVDGELPRPWTGLMTSTRDMARLGLLVLCGGTWDGREIIRDKQYLSAATATSQALNPSYGYLWWLNGKDGYVLPGRGRAGRGPMVPSAPSDLVCALGAGDQKIYVSRSLDLVVARQGGPSGQTRDEALSSFDADVWERIIAAAPGGRARTAL